MTIASSEDQFNANAGKYAVSDVHRAGPSLPVLLELAAPVAGDCALDVATGPGHTALKKRFGKPIIRVGGRRFSGRFSV